MAVITFSLPGCKATVPLTKANLAKICKFITHDEDGRLIIPIFTNGLVKCDVLPLNTIRHVRQLDHYVIALKNKTYELYSVYALVAFLHNLAEYCTDVSTEMVSMSFSRSCFQAVHRSIKYTLSISINDLEIRRKNHPNTSDDTSDIDQGQSETEEPSDTEENL